MKLGWLVSSILLIFLNISFAKADNIRDYYAEPGIQPFKELLNQNFSENIDPFGGSLQLKYTDILIPGNGGLDIKINRVYNSLQDKLGVQNVNGVGWSMHFGRIIVKQIDAPKICTQNSWSVSVLDNPSLELPDGGREILVLDLTENYLVTKSRWKAHCVAGQPGMVVTAPNGTRYIMSQYDYDPLPSLLDGHVSFYTTRIEDTNGNYINISYNIDGNDSLLNTVTASDGRTVIYNYQTYGSRQLISSITANNQTWHYDYERIPDQLSDYYQLTTVLRPDGTRWEYTYHPMYTGLTDAGSFSLKTVRYPSGGTIAYTYKQVYFDPVDDKTPTTAVATKVTGGSNIQSGTWTFDYQIGSIGDLTTIRTPTSVEEYHHWGYSQAGSGQVWSIGLLVLKKTYDLSNVLMRAEKFDWGIQLISYENFWHGRNTLKIDTATAVPVLTKKSVWREGFEYTTQYLNYDVYGNPGSIVETGNVANEDIRSTAYTYQTDPSKWIINLPKDETLTGLKNELSSILRAYDANGNLTSESHNGVSTKYTYSSEGDIRTITDDKLNTTTYLDYYRGIPRLVQKPENIEISRIVNPTGTLASETNGRVYTTAFTYDALNRLTSIDYPIHSDVSIAWTSNTKSLTRGRFTQVVTFDGFGREIESSNGDTQTSQNIVIEKRYDAIGRLGFESYPNSATGTSYTYDALDREHLIQHPDGSFKRYDYIDNLVYMTDEENNTTMTFYRAVGEPERDRVIIGVDSPENVATIMFRNTFGQPDMVVQGSGRIFTGVQGLLHLYFYDSRYYLTSEVDSELGQVVYGRDVLGNKTSRTVADFVTTLYTYDALNRLETINYPDTTPDVSYVYDKNSNIEQISSTNSVRVYTRDENDNITQEDITINGTEYSIKRSYDDLDALSILTYPTNRTVQYNPDAFGRARSALPYVSGVGYYPSGQTAQIIYANGVTTNMSQTNRLWVDTINVDNGAQIAGLEYDYDSVGNIRTISDAVTPGYSRSFGYDGLNRLSSASGIWGTGSVVYDELGNIRIKQIGAMTIGYEYVSNRLSTVTRNGVASQKAYDINGNIVSDGDGTYAYTYDLASNLSSARALISSPTAASIYAYTYDGNNYRVTRTNDDLVTNYIYSYDTNLLSEITGITRKDNIYLNGQLVAVVDNSENIPPVADAGVAQTVAEGAVVSLDGSASNDPDGTITTHAWSQVSGYPVTITSAASPIASFIAPSANANLYGVYVFQLEVTDNDGEKSTAEVSITVNMLDTDNDGLSDIWEQNYFATLALDGTVDPDGDGVNNLSEFLAGTDPTLQPVPVDIPRLAALPSNGKNILLWDDIPYAASYDLYWSTTTGVTIATGNLIPDVISGHSHTGLTNGVTYYYVVVAKNPAGESLESNEAWATPGMTGWFDLPPIEMQGEAIEVGTYNFIGRISDVKVDASGNAVFTWTGVRNSVHSYRDQDLYGRLNRYAYVSMQKAGDNWSPPISVDLEDDSQSNGTPSLSVTASGNIFVVWMKDCVITDPDTGAITTQAQIWGNRYTPDGGWEGPQRLDDSQGNANNPRIATDRDGNAILTWIEYQLIDGIWINRIVAKTFNAVTGWSIETVAVNAPDNIQISGFTMDQAGNAIVSWVKYITDADGTRPESFWAATYTPSAGWQVPVLLSQGMGSVSSIVHHQQHAAGHSWLLWGEVLPADPLQYSLWGRQYDPVTGWSEPVAIDNRVTGTFNNYSSMYMAINASGEAVLSGQIYNGTWQSFSYRYTPGGGWLAFDIPVTLLSDVTGQVITSNLAIGDDGTIIAIRADVAGHIETNRYTPDSGWSAGELIDGNRNYYGWETGTSGGSHLPKATLDKNGNVIAVWTTDYLSEVGLYMINSSYYQHVLLTQPVAKSGDDRIASFGSTVTLDGRHSFDKNGSIIQYQWSQTMGPTVVLQDTDTALASFVAPTFVDATKLRFKLTVTDDTGETGTDAVTITAMTPNLWPIADAGADFTVIRPSASTDLDGRASYDPDGVIRHYLWEQIGGPTVFYGEIRDAKTSYPYFYYWHEDTSAALTFLLSVTDDRGAIAKDTVTVTYHPIIEEPIAPIDAIEGTEISIPVTAYAPIVAYTLTESGLLSVEYPITYDPVVSTFTFTLPAVTADITKHYIIAVESDTGALQDIDIFVNVRNVP